MALPTDLLEVLVDPQDHQPLRYFAPGEQITGESEGFLYNERTKQRYPISPSGIAVLLADEAVSVSDDEHKRLLAEINEGKAVVTGTKGQA